MNMVSYFYLFYTDVLREYVSFLIGKTVSERKDMIDTIVAHFNIQVDNPMCMLNQDVAKNFLNTKSTKEKYNVRFLKSRDARDQFRSQSPLPGSD